MKTKLSSNQITSLDEFGQQIHLNPAEVRGKYRNYRTIVQSILVVFFLAVPWTYMNGRQTLLINIPNREFSIFGFALRAHNAPLLLFLILGGALSLAFVTSIWGRVWCGWTCPQTVFIDGLFRRIEKLVEGSYLARRKLAAESLTFKIAFKKLLKWFLFYLASLIISHSFLSYFVGSSQFIHIMQQLPSANMKLFIIGQVLTFILLFNFGWFREQFCTIMCPYGRIQGLLIDGNSMIVGYDEKRNDCVSCNRCVNACPIGIDIRNGLQMECIACTACIDACDEIMEKVNKPKGLVKYTTPSGAAVSMMKPRSVLYLLGILFCVSGLIYSLATLKHTEVFVLRSKNETFTEKNEGGTAMLLNQFRFHIKNQSASRHKYKVKILNEKNIVFASQFDELVVEGHQSFDWHFFLSLPKNDFFPGKKIELEVYDSENPSTFTKVFEVTLLGPYQ
jgi:polyferredoxin